MYSIHRNQISNRAIKRLNLRSLLDWVV